MTLEEIKSIAGRHGIKTGRMKKADIIRAIQNAEMNEPCFSVGKSEQCGQEICLWRGECS